MGHLLKENSVITKAVLDLETLSWGSVERESYSGPWALCDRAAQRQANQAANTAGSVAGQEESAAGAERAALTPFYKSYMNATHAFDPTQTNELLNAAAAPLAGTGATAMGEANSEAARTRNTSGFSSALDQSARDRARAMSNANLDVGKADILGAKQENLEGAQGMEGLYGIDTGAMLKAMGLQNEDINTEIQAGKQGWFQNLLNGVNTFTGGAGFGGKAGGITF